MTIYTKKFLNSGKIKMFKFLYNGTISILGTLHKEI